MSGSLTHSPSQILQKLLVDLSLGTLASDGGSWPITAGQEPDTPTGRGSTIFVRETEGILQGRSMLSGYVFEKHGLNIGVRDTRYGDGRTKAQAIAIALDSVTLQAVVVSSSVYAVSGFHRSGSVLHAGKEGGSARHRFSINGYLTVRET